MARPKKDTSGISTINKNEIRWVSVYDIDKALKYIITSNKDRSLYYIYDANFNKLGSAKNPTLLENKYFNK